MKGRMRKRYKHGLSYGMNYTCDMGELIPSGLTEVLPGDTIQQSTSTFSRVLPMVAPPMHRVNLHTHHIFVPNRILWDNWENFITGGEDGNDASVHPTITFGGGSGVGIGDLGDYMGLPTGVDGITVNALPFRAYALIYNEIYRDQDLQDPIDISTADGDDTTTSTALKKVNWERDIFTKARPWEQKGPAVTIPLAGTAPVKVPAAAGISTAVFTFHDEDDNPREINAEAAQAYLRDSTPSGLPQAVANLAAASGIDMIDLRQALGLQQFAEARAVYGSRFVEYLEYLGVHASDHRLQRPEFLSSGRDTLQFSEVLQTAEGASASNPVGDIKGHGVAVSRSNRYKRTFNEHGWIVTLQFYRPKTMYTDGIAKHWLRLANEDYWQLELQNIGQRAVQNQEIYAAHTSPTDTFGYSDRYIEYRQGYDRIAGDFRNLLDHWHFGRSFASDPALNASFVECVPTKEPFAVQSSDVMLAQARHSIQSRRLVTNDPTPGLRRM